MDGLTSWMHAGAVRVHESCPAGDECGHCAAGRPHAPVEAEDPRELSMGVAMVHAPLRLALPPAYHRPEWMAGRAGWFCACCWDVAWPCLVVSRHPRYLDRSLRLEASLARRTG